jgi:PRC-barrel domain protein
MKKTTILAAALLTTVSSVALAQTPSSPANSAPTATTKTQTSGTGLQQQVTTNLQNSGFTNVKVMPDSFLVQATDKSGNPVTMFIGPNSMSEVTTVGANGQASETNTSASAKNTGGTFTSVPASDELSSKVVGLDVYNNDHQNIGMIKDVAYNGTSVSGYILGVGGFLGMGDHYVAVRPSAVKLSYDTKDSKWHATMDANAGQLKSAPEYKYPSRT